MYKHLVQTVDNIMSAWLIKLNDRDKNYYEKGDDYANATDQNVNDSVYDADDYYSIMVMVIVMVMLLIIMIMIMLMV